MSRREIEGGWFMGWADRKRLGATLGKDHEDRVINARTPFLDQEGLITPTDATYVVAQLQVPDPVHPDDYSFEIAGQVERPETLTLDQVRRLPGHTVRAVIECAGNDTNFWDYLSARAEGRSVPKPSY
jgi:DMSO/TMAO reductase YedYZ molybdopterin-dependent catalytic subunit